MRQSRKPLGLHRRLRCHQIPLARLPRRLRPIHRNLRSLHDPTQSTRRDLLRRARQARQLRRVREPLRCPKLQKCQLRHFPLGKLHRSPRLRCPTPQLHFHPGSGLRFLNLFRPSRRRKPAPRLNRALSRHRHNLEDHRLDYRPAREGNWDPRLPQNKLRRRLRQVATPLGRTYSSDRSLQISDIGLGNVDRSG